MKIILEKNEKKRSTYQTKFFRLYSTLMHLPQIYLGLVSIYQLAKYQFVFCVKYAIGAIFRHQFLSENQNRKSVVRNVRNKIAIFEHCINKIDKITLEVIRTGRVCLPKLKLNSGFPSVIVNDK